MKTSRPPSVRCPCESSQVPSPITSSAPLSSIRSIERRVERLQPDGRHLGVVAAQVLAMEALDLRLPPGRRPGRGRHSKGSPPPPELIEPLRRRFSREATLIRREKRFAASQKRGATSSEIEREIPLQVEEGGGEEDDRGARRRWRRSRPERTKRLDRGDVAGEARDQVAEPPAIEEVEREPLQVREEPGAEVEQEALADPVGEKVIEEAETPAIRVRPTYAAAIQAKGPKSLRHQHLVDDELEHPDHRRVDERDERDQQEAEREPAGGRAGRTARTAGRSREPERWARR